MSGDLFTAEVFLPVDGVKTAHSCRRWQCRRPVNTGDNGNGPVIKGNEVPAGWAWIRFAHVASVCALFWRGADTGEHRIVWSRCIHLSPSSGCSRLGGGLKNILSSRNCVSPADELQLSATSVLSSAWKYCGVVASTSGPGLIMLADLQIVEA